MSKRLLSTNFLLFISAGVFILILTNIFLFKKISTQDFSSSCKNCNIVIIDIDILRQDVLECDSGKTTSPNICGLADTSVYFKNNASHSDYTFISFISGVTSLYPSSHSMWHPQRDKLSSYVVTLADVLKESGYHTMFVGNTKNENVLLNGFDDKFNASDYFLTTDLVQIYQQASSAHRPFFLYIHTASLHFPYFWPEEASQQSGDKLIPEGIPTNRDEYRTSLAEYIASHYSEVFTTEAIEMYPDLFTGDVMKNRDKILDLFANLRRNDLSLLKQAWEPMVRSLIRYIDTNNPKHVFYLKMKYLEALSSIDEKLSDLLSFFSSLEFADDTIVVIKSNHGEEFYEHGEFNHQNNLYQELIHTPLIINVPDINPHEEDALSQDIDIFPTLLELVGIEIPAQAQGKSLVPLMNEKKDSVNDYQIAQKDAGSIAAYRKGNWKLLIKDGEPAELYNLETDPGEQSNLVKENEAIGLQMLEEYKQIISNQKKYLNPESSFPDWIDEEKRKQLMEQGYF